MKNDPAFPTQVEYQYCDKGHGDWKNATATYGGVTKLELFAGLAMLGMLANSDKELISQSTDDKIAQWAVTQAEALIKQLEANQK